MQKVAYTPEVYNRIKLFRNDQIEILLLCWEKNQGSPIHNHPQHGMVMKVLEGELFENRYKSLTDIEKPIAQFVYKKGMKPTYINDKLFVHSVTSGD